MEQFATEEQQVEAIKRFWKDNGTAIIIGAVLGLGGLWGWRYYSDNQKVAREEASTQYQAAVQAIEEDNSAAKLETFVSETDNQGYATIGGLVAAQQAVSSGDLEKAASLLSNVQSKAADDQLSVIAGIRLARVQLASGDTDAALATISGLSSQAFAGRIDEVKGDIYVAQQKFDNARVAYTSAMENSAGNRLLEMKLDNLSVLSDK